MAQVKRDWDILSDAERRYATSEIIGYFETARGEKVGIVAAGQLLDVVLRAVHGPIYNRALDDVKVFFEKGLGDVSVNADVSLRKG